jgi:hypothetical protein
MRGLVPPDPQTNVSQHYYAVVYVPRRSRKRFSASCVALKEDRQSAIEQADPTRKYYAAVVLGPSKSSEGQYIYYLREWL